MRQFTQSGVLLDSTKLNQDETIKPMKSFTPLSASYNPYDLLRVYTYYRTLMGVILLLMFQSGIAPQALGMDAPDLFFNSSLGYTIFNVITLVVLWRTHFFSSQKALFSLFLIEIGAIILLMHASGGAPSGIGYLLLVAAAAGGMLLRGQIAFFLAALASLGVISESIYRSLSDTLPNIANSTFSA